MRAAIVFAALALAACQTPCPAPDIGPVTAQFECEDGSSLVVTFRQNGARIVQEGYTTLDLPERVSGSGYRYAAQGAELRGRSREARWTRPGAAETLCSQVD